MSAYHIPKLSTLIFFISFLCGSCHTYKELDTSEHTIEVDKKYKIITTDGDNYTMYVSKVSDSTLMGKYKGINTEIPRKKVQQIKKGKFSPFKTFIVLPASIATAGVGWFFLALSLR